MSEYIYKVFPAKIVKETKTNLIKPALLEAGFITGEEFIFEGEKYIKAGLKFCDLVDVSDNVRVRYQNEVRIVINDEGYGLFFDEDDELFPFDRKNLVEIYNIDGDYLSCDKLAALLEKLTGDKYLSEVEVL